MKKIHCPVCYRYEKGDKAETVQPMSDNVTLTIGSHHTVTLDKLFGPLVCCALRIRVDAHKGEWVIEREVSPLVGDSTWEEVCRIDVQESMEFDDSFEQNLLDPERGEK